MFRATVAGREFLVRFHRPDDVTTACEILTGDDVFSKGRSRRLKADRYDRVKGHVVALAHALHKGGMDRAGRKAVFAQYAAWAEKNHIKTKLNLKKTGR